MRLLTLLGAAIEALPVILQATIAAGNEDRKLKNVFSECHPGGIEGVVITKHNTLNGTHLHHSSKDPASSKSGSTYTNAIGINTAVTHSNLTTRGMAAVRTLPIKLVNNLNGSVKAYIAGKDEAGRVLFLREDGSTVYPDAGKSRVPVPINGNIGIPLDQGELTVNLPFPLGSGRVYFAAGGDLKFFVVSTTEGNGIVQPSITNLQDPSANITWGFVELTYTKNCVIWANLSFVDFVGLPFGMAVRTLSGTTHTVKGLPKDAIRSICADFEAQGNQDRQPWAQTCIVDGNRNPVRVLSPNMFRFIDDGAFRTYWTQYVDQVWSTYSRKPMRIDTQSAFGVVNCQVRGSELQCGGDNRGYVKPSAEDIWTCDGGPFHIRNGDNAVHYAVVPRLCAAFVRTTLLLAGGDKQPGLVDQYYKNNPTSYYSRVIYMREIDGKGYAFPYDDVSLSGSGDAAGFVAANDAKSLTFFVGGI